jgi:general secretion pathway protein A
MYQEYFGFKTMPFNTTPDSRFFFPSSKHAEALASLIYAITERKGFVVITGEVGSGKTTVCRTLLSKVSPNTRVLLITNTNITGGELIEVLCTRCGLRSEGMDKAARLEVVQRYLREQYESGQEVLLIIDEAQNLPADALEEIRMLSNFETETSKLLQIILLGQPELRRRLAQPELRQFRQRIVITYHLAPLDRREAIQYIFYRLKIAGGTEAVKFTRRAMDALFLYSKGIPRLINILCDN